MTNTVIKAIIGLGNPGHQYHYTRHNIGFRIIDQLAQHYNVTFKNIDNMQVAQTQLGDHVLYLIKPQTFMNNSGQILPWLRKKGIAPEQLLIVHDELELPFGSIKTKFGGSAKGHNGIKSLIQHAGTTDFWRLRFGIGRPEDRNRVPDYVLSNFTAAEVASLDNKTHEAIEIIIDFIR